jgi:carboxyl-terminal processing protease
MKQCRNPPRAIALAVALLVSCWCADLHPAFAADAAEIDRASLLDAVIERVEQKFFDVRRLKEIDWRARAEAARASVLAAPTTDEAARQINALLAELKTSHTGLFTPDDYFYPLVLDVVGPHDSDLIQRRFWGAGPYYPGTGAFTRIADGRHFIDAVLEGSPADRAGLRYGDEILAVDGMAYSPIAAFRGKIGTTVELAIRRHAGAEPEHVPVEVVPLHPVKAFGDATATSARVIERGGKRIGYIHIWASAESTSFRAALRKLEGPSIAPGQLRLLFEPGASIRSAAASTPASNAALETPKPVDFLIVDVRGKIGGHVGVISQVLEALDARSYWGGDLWWGRPGDFVGRTRPGASYRGRAALLINSDTRSAAEIMAYGFKRSAFGPVIGTNTAGAVSSGAIYAMPGDLLLYVAVSGGEIDGKRLEGVGVAPDVRVERPLPYANGADPVLEAALDLLATGRPKE